MAHLFFFLAAVTASLLWTAVFIAAAARVKTCGWLLRIIAVGIPFLAWLPWLALTTWLSFNRHIPTNWLAPTLTAFLSTLIGSLSIMRVGLSPRGGAAAGRWPIPGLAAGFGAALLTAGTAIAVLEHDLERWASGLRAEATGMMASVVPPPLAADANAATLYREAIWISKTAFAISAEEVQRLFGDNPLPVPSDEVGDVLERQGPLVDLIRRGAARDECRFDRDWSRPTISMLLPETQEMRGLARLLWLSARRQAVDGQPAEALADVNSLSRMAKHTAREPFVVSSLVGMAIDGIALAALAEVLPEVTHADQLDGIDPLGFSQATELRHAATTCLICEEAMYLNTAADLADKRIRWSQLDDNIVGIAPGLQTPVGTLPDLGPWLDPLYRTFMLRWDIDDFRPRFEGFARHFSGWFFEQRDPGARRRHLGESTDADGAGLYTKLFMPAFSQMNMAAWRSEARRNIASVLLAATRYRLATGALPESLESLVPDYLPSAPADAFGQDNATLRLVSTESTWTVYSIGDNGRDDGGPPSDGTEPAVGNDDIGLTMKR